MKAKRLLAALTALMICLSVTIQPALADFEEPVVTEEIPVVQPAEEENTPTETVSSEETSAEVSEEAEGTPATEGEQTPPESAETPTQPEESGTEETVQPDEEETLPEAPQTEPVDTVAETEPAAPAVPEVLADTLSEEENQPAMQDVGGVELNESNFPDAAFRAVVSGFDKDGSGSLSPEEIAAVTGIYASRKGISDLTGIEHFTALKALEVSDNSLTSLNLSSNTTLESVIVSDNKLTSLNVSKLTNLALLWADNNSLTNLDLSNNPLDGGQSFSVTENALTQITLPASGRFNWEDKVGGQRLPGGKERGYQLKWYTDSSYANPLQLSDGMIDSTRQTLYGQAEAIQYTVTFSAGSESVTGNTNELKATYDQNVQLPVCGFKPTDSEREFAGWKLGGSTYTENQEVKNLTDRDGATVELVAQWRYKDYSGEQYSITLYDGEGGQETFKANYGTDAAITTSLKKDHYHLVGWARQEGGPVWLKAGKTISYTRPSLLEADLGQQPALYAVWAIDRHTVTFAGIDTAPKAVTVDYGSKITLPAAPHRTGYVFEGWYTESGTAWDQQSHVVEKDMTLTARYRAAQFTIKFDGNGADNGTMSEMQVTYDQAQNLTRNGYTLQWHDFAGWSFTPNGQAAVMDEADASRLSITDGDTVTLYAVWKRQQTDVTVTINGEEQQHKTGLGIALEIPDPQRTGWRFTGWLDEHGGKWQADTPVTGPLNLTASFEPIEYSVVFNGNGADNAKAMENAKLSLTYDQKTDLPANQYTRAGHTFLGWSRTPGGKVEYGNGVSVSALTATDGAVVTLYAVWQGPPAAAETSAGNSSHSEEQAPAASAVPQMDPAPVAVPQPLKAERFTPRPAQLGGKEQPGTEAAAEENLTQAQQETGKVPQKAEESTPHEIGNAQKNESSRPDWVRALAVAVGAVVLVGGGGFAAAYALHFKKR